MIKMRYLMIVVVAVALAACSESPTALPRDGSTSVPTDTTPSNLPRTVTF